MASANPFTLDERKARRLSEEDKAQLRGILSQLSDYVDQNPLIGFVPYDKQRTFHLAPQRTRAFYGGNRTGKTTTGVVDDLIQALPKEMVPPHLLPYKKFGFDEPFLGRVITPDLGHTMEAVIEKFRELTPRSALGGPWESAFDRTKRILRFQRGDIIDFMSFEQDPDKFGGVKRHRIHYDEEPNGPNSYKIWRDSRMRLIDTGGDEIFTMTPLMGLSWVYNMLWEKRAEDGICVIQATMYDNPYLSKEEIAEALKTLSKEERQAIELGEPVHFEGIFYPEFKHAFHVRKKAPRPDEIQGQTVVVGIDPGQHTGVVWVAFDNSNDALVFEELCPDGALPDEVATQIKEVNDRWGVKPRYVIDPSARNRSGPNQEQFEAEYARHGIFCEHGQNARGPGITTIKRRLQHNNLVISPDCRGLIWEFPHYRRKPDSPDEWEAIKEDDHLLDALRYAVMSRTWTLPKVGPRQAGWNTNPLQVPPWGGPTPKPPPPLGVYS